MLWKKPMVPSADGIGRCIGRSIGKPMDRSSTTDQRYPFQWLIPKVRHFSTEFHSFMIQVAKYNLKKVPQPFIFHNLLHFQHNTTVWAKLGNCPTLELYGARGPTCLTCQSNIIFRKFHSFFQELLLWKNHATFLQVKIKLRIEHKIHIKVYFK